MDDLKILFMKIINTMQLMGELAMKKINRTLLHVFQIELVCEGRAVYQCK